MIPMPSGVRVWIAAGHTDMRRGMQGLALQVSVAVEARSARRRSHIFLRRRGDLAKILWHDGLGLSLYAKRLTGESSLHRRRRASCRSHSMMAYMLEGRSTGGIHN